MLGHWKESCDKPRQYIKRQTHHFADKGPHSQSFGFPLAMYRCESWTIKKAEHQRIDALELWCWRRLLTVPWTARRSNQSILKEINPEYSLKGLMLKRKLLWPPDVNSWLIGKDPDAGKDWRQEEKGTTEDEMVGWHHWLNWHEFEQASGDGKGQGSLACPWGHRVRHNCVTEQEGKNLKLPLNIWKTVRGHVKESLNLFSVIPGERD